MTFRRLSGAAVTLRWELQPGAGVSGKDICGVWQTTLKTDCYSSPDVPALDEINNREKNDRTNKCNNQTCKRKLLDTSAHA